MSERIEVQIVDNQQHSRVEGRTPDGVLAGFSQYYVRDGSLVFFHTEVTPELEGHGVGSQIAAGVVEFVRSRNMPVSPECPFIRQYMAKHPETHDILTAGFSLAPDPE